MDISVGRGMLGVSSLLRYLRLLSLPLVAGKGRLNRTLLLVWHEHRRLMSRYHVRLGYLTETLLPRRKGCHDLLSLSRKTTRSAQELPLSRHRHRRRRHRHRRWRSRHQRPLGNHNSRNLPTNRHVRPPPHDGKCPVQVIVEKTSMVSQLAQQVSVRPQPQRIRGKPTLKWCPRCQGKMKKTGHPRTGQSQGARLARVGW